MLKVHSAGLWTSVQDLGRPGYRHFGVPLAGVMDRRSARLANLLLNNPPEAAVLEMTMTGPQLEFNAPTRLVLTGANMSPRLNAQPCVMNKVIEIDKGDRLRFGSLQYGLRTYLAIEGGLQTSVVMDSRSFYSNITEQGRLVDGISLRYLAPSNQLPHSHASVKVDKTHFSNQVLDVYPGPEFEYLSKQQKEQLLQSEFTVSPHNDRMAYQLEELIENSLETILTSAVLPGTVQLTPAGKLLVLMRDCQTTGGYPRILQLAEQTMNQLAQKRQGDKCRFKLIQ